MTSVRLPDGSLKEFDSVVTVKDVAKSIGSRLAKDALWGEIDMQPVELDFEIPTGDPVNLKIVTEPFERIDETREKALAICKDLKQEFKVEHIETGLADDETLSFYQQGEFVDLCRGPHVPSPKRIGAFKLLSIAGAYWKGDQSRQQLQRL